MSGWMIWGTALALYDVFRLWYDNWRGPLSKAEIDAFLGEVQGRYSGGNDPAVLRRFLEEDDGKEFVMLNLVKIEEGMVTHPQTGEQVTGRSMMRRYSDPFVKALLRRGGHPGMVGAKVGPYVDAWNVEGDPDWSIFGLMRTIREQGYTVLIVEQNIQQVLKVVDRAYLLETGRIRSSGPAAELLASDEIRRAYLGV